MMSVLLHIRAGSCETSQACARRCSAAPGSMGSATTHTAAMPTELPSYAPHLGCSRRSSASGSQAVTVSTAVAAAMLTECRTRGSCRGVSGQLDSLCTPYKLAVAKIHTKPPLPRDTCLTAQLPHATASLLLLAQVGGVPPCLNMADTADSNSKM